MHEHGVIDAKRAYVVDYAARLEVELRG